MLVVFSPIFVADKKLIFVYNFVGPLKVAWKCSKGIFLDCLVQSLTIFHRELRMVVDNQLQLSI